MLDYRRVVPFSSIASPKTNPILLPNQGDFSAFSQADPVGKKHCKSKNGHSPNFPMTRWIAYGTLELGNVFQNCKAYTPEN